MYILVKKDYLKEDFSKKKYESKFIILIKLIKFNVYILCVFPSYLQ